MVSRPARVIPAVRVLQSNLVVLPSGSGRAASSFFRAFNRSSASRFLFQSFALHSRHAFLACFSLKRSTSSFKYAKSRSSSRAVRPFRNSPARAGSSSISRNWAGQSCPTAGDLQRAFANFIVIVNSTAGDVRRHAFNCVTRPRAIEFRIVISKRARIVRRHQPPMPRISGANCSSDAPCLCRAWRRPNNQRAGRNLQLRPRESPMPTR